jgi:hypothetical protein
MRVLLSLAIIAPLLLHSWTGIRGLPALWFSALGFVVISKIDQKVIAWIRQACLTMRRPPHRR